MRRIVWVTVIVLLGASLISWIRDGDGFHIAKAFPLIGGYRVSIYDLAGVILIFIAARGLIRMRRGSGR